MIYLAQPYSHPDPEVRQARYETAIHAVVCLALKGYHVFSPIVNSHPLVLACPSLGGEFEQWREFDEAMIARSDAVYVLMIDGWSESVGVKAEMEYAHLNDIPVWVMTLADVEAEADVRRA